MIQELFRIGPISISPFGVMMVAAFVAAYLQLRRGLEVLGVGGEEDASAIVLAAGLGGIGGAKLYYALLYRDLGLLFSRSGLVWYGGFLLATVLIVWTIRRRRLPAWSTLDAASVGLALGYGIGRIGCFLVGDDYGVPTEMPWGVAFENGLPPTTAGNLRSIFGVEIPATVPNSELLAVHPTQLYETGMALVIFVVGWRMLRKGLPAGSTCLVMFALLAVERFIVEFFRAKDDRFVGGLTLAQGISIAILIAVAVLWRYRGAVPRGAPAKGSRGKTASRRKAS